jgi:hypothetical protein
MFIRTTVKNKGNVICDVCESIIEKDVDKEDSQSAEDQDGYHYCLQHLFISDKFTTELKEYAKQNKTTDLAGFVAWKMLQ